MANYTFSEAQWKSMYQGNALSASRFLAACDKADGKPQRKFYIGDKVLILDGPHAGNYLLVCGIAEDYIAGGLDGVTVKIPKQFAKIVSR